MVNSLSRPRTKIRVYICAPDNMTAELLKNSFSHNRGAFVIKTLTGTAQGVLDQLKSSKPDVALISEELEDGPHAGFEVLHKLRSSHASTAAIMLLKCSHPDRVVDAFRGGARGIFYKSHSLKALSKCIRTVHHGQIWVGNEDLEHILKTLARVKPLQFRGADGNALLTGREQDVVQLVVDGMKNREIAQRLQVTEHSVRNYVYRIFDKLGISSRVELILYAMSKGKPA